MNPSDLKNKGIEEFSQKKFDESICTFKKLDSIAHNDNYETYAHYALGHIYGKEKLDTRKGIYYLKQSLPYLRNKKKNFSSHQLTTYYLLGEYYYALGNIDSSEYYLKEGFNIYLDHQEDLRFPISFIHHLSNIYYRKHEYHMSQAILDYGLKNHKRSNRVVFINKLSNHVKLDDTLAINETVRLLEKNFDVSDLSGNQYYHLSIYTFNHKKYTETIHYLKLFLKAFDQYYKNSDPTFFSTDEILFRNFYIARAHLKLSECYKHLDKPEEQLSSLKTALTYYQKGKSSPHIDITSIGLEIFRSLKDYDNSHDINAGINYLDSAQQIIDEEFSVRSDTNEIMRYELMIQNYYKGKYASTLKCQKDYYWKSYEYFHDFIWQQQKDDDLLYHFEELNTIQDEWIEFFSQSYIKDKNFDDLAKALEIIENAKSNILKKRSSGLNDPDFMTYIKSDFLISDKNNQKSVSPRFTSKDLKKYFKDNYDDKSFISFYYTKDNFYRITYNEGKFDLSVIKYDDTTLDKLIEIFSKSNYFISRDFIEQLDKFGKYVLPDWVNSTDNKRLVISPYGKLNSIPFEVLIFNDKYLLESFATTYSYSIHYSKKNLQKNTIYDKVNTFAIAPFANSDLQYTEEEVKDINADYLLNQEATYNSLQKALQNRKYNVLHFATHSIFKSIPQDSYISLYPDKSTKSRITFDEISNINLQHINLVVLSSCQSGVGAFSKGEGDLSLQRAFAYADIPSVIAGKWKVNDKSSAIIINNFYNYLSEGWEKDIALQKAKLLYIENNEHMYYNPMFWGGLVLNGNNNALVPPSIETRVRKLFH
ncbi:CHAT domain-containing protein [Flammeovirga sp. MY04]|uniref:CHAT domain-containing protein n=1 Tax=Flammeovirga sp. MY04 TaxID=1191459 RepID=UPI0008063947|nr:CHAT domain-containing tetratricopeptide repeat protein [Flammeovirga sp. MY04]ANQ49930.1 CHAT domain-containing protein [Flammeovirga sp. MY04]